jgi:hypothetical protein
MRKALEIKEGGYRFQLDLSAIAHHLAFSSFNQISASMRRNWTS